MCGICGIASTESQLPGLEGMIASMNGVLAHRGPDGEGAWFGEGIALGHRRLAIIDLSERGLQPMFSDDGRLAMICNGEIYNHRELRAQLAEEGYPFGSDTDVEAILPLYQRHGVDCAKHMVGMFAFAVWDMREKRLMLCRDRIGEKPLYYAVADGKLAFASEMKALLALPWVNRTLDEEAVAHMQVFQAAPAPMTFFKGIRALPPASWLIWENGRVRTGRYWALSYGEQNWRDEDAIEEYGRLLGRSVDGCLVADVPVGVMLSGGADSSTIAALAAANHGGIRSFCISAEGTGPDPEIERAARVAERLGTRHSLVRYPVADLSRLPYVLRQYDQPFNNYACTYADTLAQRMRQEVTVVLSGNAADEIFGGYRAYNPLLGRNMLYGLGRFAPGWLPMLLPEPARGRAEGYLEISKSPVSRWREIALTRAGRAQMAALCSPEFTARWRDFEPGRLVALHAEESGARTLLQSVMYSDLMVYHHHGHGIMTDIAGMTYGLEYRSPFLDHRLIEFAATLPQRLLVPDGRDKNRNKLIMKRFLGRFLPDDWIYVQKMGFGNSIDFWSYFAGPWREAIRRQVLGGKYLELGIFTPKGAERALNQSLTTAWMLLSFSVWADLYLFGDTPEQVSQRLLTQEDTRP